MNKNKNKNKNKGKENKNKGKENKGKVSLFLKNEIGYWAGLISAVITIICAFEKAPIPLWLYIIWILFITAVIIALVCKSYEFVKKSAVTANEINKYYEEKLLKNYEEKLLKCYDQFKDSTEEIHKFFHNMRDHICTYNYFIKKQGSENYLEQMFRNVCSDIESIFNKLWINEKVSVCIKRIIPQNQSNIDNDFMNWEVETIARSISTKQCRNKNNKKRVKIEENSDFLIIISPEYEDSVFSCMDLTKVNKEFFETYNRPYRNSTKDYLKYYKSTIVAPIRIQVDKMNPKVRPKWMEGIDYHLVGFLCIDTEKVFSGNPVQFDIGVEIAKASADMLYNLIENVLVTTTINKENTNE